MGMVHNRAILLDSTRTVGMSRRQEIYDRKDELFEAGIDGHPDRKEEIRRLNEELEQLMRDG
jgi:hypothetical protein